MIISNICFFAILIYQQHVVLRSIILIYFSRANQEVVEQSFMLTLQTVLEAPPISPLAEVDINNVAELLVQLTSEHHQLQPLDSTKVSEHIRRFLS